MRCHLYRVDFPAFTIPFWVFSDQQLFYGCPVCQDIHMLWGSLVSRPGEVVTTCGLPDNAEAETVEISAPI